MNTLSLVTMTLVGPIGRRKQQKLAYRIFTCKFSISVSSFAVSTDHDIVITSETGNLHVKIRCSCSCSYLKSYGIIDHIAVQLRGKRISCCNVQKYSRRILCLSTAAVATIRVLPSYYTFIADTCTTLFTSSCPTASFRWLPCSPLFFNQVDQSDSLSVWLRSTNSAISSKRINQRQCK